MAGAALARHEFMTRQGWSYFALFLAVACSISPEGARSDAPRSGAARAELARARSILEKHPSLSSRLGSPHSSLTLRGDQVEVALGNGARLKVELPARADGSVELLDPSGVGLGFRLLGARSLAFDQTDSIAVYTGAVAGGAWMLRTSEEGVEDYVVVADPSVSELSYQVDVTRAAGLRFLEGMLELLDAGGAPRLRVHAPVAIDSAGRVVPLAVSLERCSYDSDPRPPFGRSVVPPGSEHCKLGLSWVRAGLRYPILVDPAWTSTGSMAHARIRHAMVPLPSGKVLTAMGLSAAGIYTGKEVEIYDPATGTWANAKNTLAVHNEGSLIGLSNGKALVFGDINAPESELYDESTGNWTESGAMAYPRYTQNAGVRLSDGRVLVAGGLLGPNANMSELYDPATGTWSNAGPINQSRWQHAMLELGDGRVLIAGGGTGFAQSDPIRSSAETWSPTTKAWTLVGSMSAPRTDIRAITLGNGKVLIAGGYRNDSLPKEQATTEIFDPASNAWTPGPSMNVGRWGYTVQKLGDGRHLIMGGCLHTDPASEDSELLAVSGSSFANAGKFADTDRCASASAPLAGGKVLISGGGNILFSSEVWALVANGGSCTLGTECASGACVDGMCCSSSCGGVCESCLAAKTGGQNGTCAPIQAATDPDTECGACRACDGSGQCAPVSAGSDPNSDCKDTGSPACQEDGACDGAGACQKYAASAGCTPSACSSGAECASGFCKDGICCDKACNGTCEACTSAKKGTGADGVCEPVAADTDPDNECAEGPGFPTSCLADGDCDGAGKCREFAKATVSCGVTQCVSGNAQGLLCNGAGQCLNATQSCEPYVCQNDQCGQSCTLAADCATGSYCASQGACLPEQPDGAECSEGKECTSGHCVDGYCCAEACSGQCEACNVVPNAGTCSPVLGAPVGKRPACPGEGDDCGGSCDGVNRTACTVPPTGEACGAPSCVDTDATFSTCDGKGACVEQSKDCAPYACEGTTCGSTCAADADCAQGFKCDITSGKCVPAAGKCLSDGVTLETSNGQTKNCSPYRCQGGECAEPCTTSSQCVSGNACDQGKCVALSAAEESDEGGCGCRVGQRSQRGATALSLLAALLGGALGQRRRRKRER